MELKGFVLTRLIVGRFCRRICSRFVPTSFECFRELTGTGGGHNPLNGLHGMAADAVLAYQVVTANGRFITATEDAHPDLFWALRGGGGGTFGVVTSVVVKAFPDTHATLSTFVLGNSTDGERLVSRDNFFKAVRVLWESFPTYTDAKTYSFFFIFNTNGQLTLDMKAFYAPGKALCFYNH